ncbi:Rap1a/Tai family immunity protein [Sphingobium sp. EM0848]|uniref:Rap1a/Tai family immunity protein n=1 Tax=Sphingobium sp. EM0848 TaxID=2743473 RepID=UPI0021006B8B|nr:Rap1a/Tai family immunity protein [Sphingobium sp. EM0848]
MLKYAIAAIIAFGGTTALPVAAPAQTYMFETGTTLLAKCRNKAPEYALACTAYIVGAVDGIKKDVFIGRAKPNCWPAQLDSVKVRDIVIAYLTRYPDQRKAPASVLVSVALNEQYPCQK